MNFEEKRHTSNVPPLLTSSQIDTLTQIRRLAETSTEPITVWGLSGTGKSVIEDLLENDSKLRVLHIWDADHSIPDDRVQVEFKTGLPSWVMTSQQPVRSIYHVPFDAEQIADFVPHVRGSSQPVFRTEEELRYLCKALEQLGLGSAVYFDLLSRCSHYCDLSKEVAALFLKACAQAENNDPLATFYRITDHAPVDLSFLAEKKILQQSVEIAIQTALIDGIEAHSRGVFGRDFLSDSESYGIVESIFGLTAFPDYVRDTIQWYRHLPDEIKNVDESRFLLRTAAPLKQEDLGKLCEYLKPIMNIMGLFVFGDSDAGFGPTIDAQPGRKTGLYLYIGGQQEIYDGCVYIDPKSSLRRVISDSNSSRAAWQTLYVREGACIENGTLIYGGGDHSLSHTHMGLCLGIELVLQKLAIPYDVARGDDTNAVATWDFDGTSLSTPGRLLNSVR